MQIEFHNFLDWLDSHRSFVRVVVMKGEGKMFRLFIYSLSLILCNSLNSSFIPIFSAGLDLNSDPEISNTMNKAYAAQTRFSSVMVRIRNSSQALLWHFPADLLMFFRLRLLSLMLLLV